jgi:hypothetical protein
VPATPQPLTPSRLLRWDEAARASRQTRVTEHSRVAPDSVRPMPDKRLRINALSAVLLAAAVVFLVIAIVWFVSIHPRRGILFMALTIAALLGAWFSIRRTRVS